MWRRGPLRGSSPGLCPSDTPSFPGTHPDPDASGVACCTEVNPSSCTLIARVRISLMIRVKARVRDRVRVRVRVRGRLMIRVAVRV